MRAPRSAHDEIASRAVFSIRELRQRGRRCAVSTMRYKMAHERFWCIRERGINTAFEFRPSRPGLRSGFWPDSVTLRAVPLRLKGGAQFHGLNAAFPKQSQLSLSHVAGHG